MITGFIDANRQLVFDGAVNGLVYGMLAMGVVLVFRSSRVINFAVGNMGLPGAGLLALLALRWDIPLPVAIGAAILAGIAFGGILELTVIQRLFEAPRVIVLVATIGIAQLAQGIQLAYPEVGGGIGVRYPVVTNHTVDDAFGLLITGPQLTVLIVAPTVALLLGLILDRTTFGRTVQATAANPDLSRISGINPKRVSTSVWMIAGLLSTLAAILLSADKSVSGLENIGPFTMANALAAAVLGGMRSFPRALLAGVGVGVGFSLVKFNYPVQAGLYEFLLLLAVLVAVAFQARSSESGTGRYSFTPAVRAIPERLQSIWWVRYLGRVTLGVLLAAAVALPLLITTASRHITYTTILAYAICGISVTVITGWSGQLSLGQMAFAGLGALVAASGQRAGAPFVISVGLGALGAAAIAAIVGMSALRVKGLLLAVSTFVFGLATQEYFFRRDFLTDGNTGSVPFRRGTVFGLDLDNQRTFYWFVLAVLCLTVLMVARQRTSAVGRGMLALRDNPDGAAAYGIRPVRTKLRSFALAGGVAGLGGGLLSGIISEVPLTGRFYGTGESLRLVSMAIIGGLGTVIGPVVGAAWVIGLPAFAPSNRLIPLFTSSVGLLVLLLYFPGGLVQLAYGARDRLVGWLDQRTPRGAAKTAQAPPAALRAPRTFGEATLEATDVTVRFGGNNAVSSASIRVDDGEVVALIGTNGAGKSTLMNAIGGFVPASGKIKLGDHRIDGLSPPQRVAHGLGRTFQAATLFPELTVRETVMVAVEGRKAPGALAIGTAWPPASRLDRATRAHAGELIDFLGLGRYADSVTSELSTGTRRIVELAGLLALEARVLCLDEPTAGVAQREAEAFGPLILSLRQHLDASMLIIEHDMPMVMNISDRVYCLETGEIIAEGSPDEIRGNARVIASYLGTDDRAIQRSTRGATASPAPASVDQ
ncbi:MAG: branched-chain amino acid ABC transporter permease/ATP-binding protein [Acidimicrobiales bacterium]|nr:branched-chain amino acid ABC transporter permease/ATP-binding protein [Acidimicrobiales bacterium]